MSAFDQLHPAVQRWVWDQGWPNLRPIQEASIAPIIAGDRDVVIAAPTAGGKTEAAFLPIASMLAGDRPDGVVVLCVSPLKALINDQARRLESLFDGIDARVQAWHGDVTKGKGSFWRRPAPVLLITPESLEAMLMRKAGHVRAAFAPLRYVVVDELHAFLVGSRGAQLLSLLNRLECLLGRRPVRIGLSATLGDLSLAGRFLGPGNECPATIVHGTGSSGELKVGMLTVLPDVRSKDGGTEDHPLVEEIDPAEFVPPPPPMTAAEAEAAAQQVEWAESDAQQSGIEAIAEHLFARARGRSNLVFANSRARVELLTDALVSLADGLGIPNEFFAHHGSLSRESRGEVETRLREGSLPTTVVSTSTLELGIDIGDVHSVAQVGPAPSVASLKQRVGRSGRRAGEPQILRQYVDLRSLGERKDLVAALQLPLIQAIATVEGLIAGEYETPTQSDLHLSTLVQQILSRIEQGRCGETAAGLYGELCSARGPFHQVEAGLFADLLRSLGAHEVIEQVEGGLLLPGRVGEQLTGHYSFYATFQTPEEYRVVGPGGRQLGTIPVDDPLTEGQLIVFAGRRWRVMSIDGDAKLIMVAPGPKGRPPVYAGGALAVGRRVHERMRILLSGEVVPAFVDPAGRVVLTRARNVYAALGLGKRAVVDRGDHLAVFHWAGTRAGSTLAALLANEGLQVEQAGPCLLLHETTLQEALTLLGQLRDGYPVDVMELMDIVPALPSDKWDYLLSARCLARGYLSRHIDLEGARAALDEIFRLEEASPAAGTPAAEASFGQTCLPERLD